MRVLESQAGAEHAPSNDTIIKTYRRDSSSAYANAAATPAAAAE